jgi:hypothetical protein
MIFTAVLLWLAPPLSQADPLFDLMVGTWTGRGERRQLVSGRRIAITALVETRVVGARLESRNEVREAAAEGGSRRYLKSYWMESRGDGSGRYALGAPGTLSGEGVFRDGELFVRQEFGGAHALAVESRTRFSPGATRYLERLLGDGRVLSETQIEYTRD